MNLVRYYIMNKLFMLLLFLFSTGFFLYQHSSGFSWDFIVYFLNSRFYLFGGFFEWGRPPLPSFLLIPGEYFYIVLVSVLCLFASIRFSRVFRLSPEVFYAFLLSPFLLVQGLAVGTELLSLSLTLLMFSFINSSLSGFFFSLSFMSHFSNLFNIIFLRKPKAFLLVLLTILPFLFFNYAFSGDFLYSFLNQFALNVAMRDYYIQPVDFSHFIILASFLLPFSLYGLFHSKSKFDFLMIVFIVVRVLSFLSVPFKAPRYLFLLLVPFSYFATKSLSRFNYRIAIPIFCLTLLLLPVYLPYAVLDSPKPYVDSLSHINSSCMVLSNAWPFLNYLGVNAGPSPWPELVERRVSEGYELVFFTHIGEPDYVFNESFMASLPVVYNDSSMIIVRDGCLPSVPYNLSYIEERNQTYADAFNSSFSFTIGDII